MKIPAKIWVPVGIVALLCPLRLGAAVSLTDRPPAGESREVAHRQMAIRNVVDSDGVIDQAPGEGLPFGRGMSAVEFPRSKGTVLASWASLLFALLAAIQTGRTRRFRKAVKGLKEAARAIAEGDTEIRPRPGGSAEIVDLVQAFDLLTEQIRERDRKISLCLQEREEARAAAELAHNSRVKFLATMSHDIRTPMNGMLGMMELLLCTPLSDQQRYFAGAAQRSGEALLNLIRNIFDLSRLEWGKVELERKNFDLSQILEEALELYSQQAKGKGIELFSEVSSEVPTALRGDRGRLRQVLVTLIGNAVKFTTQGKVEVRVVTAEENAANVLLRIEVRDTGIGIPAEYRSGIFEFHRQENAAALPRGIGSGFSLPIARTLVEMMGGEIGLECEPGRGSTFWLTVLQEKQLDQVRVIPAPDLWEKRALIVDRDPTDRSMLKIALQSMGMLVASSETGVEALGNLQEAAATGRPFDLVLLDGELPEPGSLELISAIRGDPGIPPLPMVMLTSLEREEADALKVSRDVSWLGKPFRQTQLRNCLVNVLGAWSRRIETGASSREEGISTSPRFDIQVLLAEDNPVNLEVARQMLINLGCRVDTARNGIEAVEAFSQASYDMIFLDCLMPEMDGYGATRIIRQREKTGEPPLAVPVIALTANALEGDREKCLAAGMDDYLAKPFNQEQLSIVLKRWLREEAGEKDP